MKSVQYLSPREGVVFTGGSSSKNRQTGYKSSNLSIFLKNLDLLGPKKVLQPSSPVALESIPPVLGSL